jgi:hypothetical protein
MVPLVMIIILSRVGIAATTGELEQMGRTIYPHLELPLQWKKRNGSHFAMF